jgi:Cu+-exporting ATPase
MAERGEVTIDPRKVSPDAVVAKITDLGYECKLKENVDRGKVELMVTGMTCSSCVQLIESALKRLEGVEKASVALSTSKCVVEYEPEIIGIRKIIQTVEV